MCISQRVSEDKRTCREAEPKRRCLSALRVPCSYKLADDEASVPVPDGVIGEEASGTEGETALDVVELSASVLVAADVVSCAGVEVDETNGGACWTYDPSG